MMVSESPVLKSCGGPPAADYGSVWSPPQKARNLKVDTSVVIHGDWRDIDFGPSEKRAPVGAQIKTYLVAGELIINMMQEEVKEVAAKDAS